MIQESRFFPALVGLIFASTAVANTPPVAKINSSDFQALLTATANSKDFKKDVQKFVTDKKLVLSTSSAGVKSFSVSVAKAPLCETFLVTLKNELIDSFQCSSGNKALTDETFVKETLSNIQKQRSGCSYEAEFSSTETHRIGRFACQELDVHWSKSAEKATAVWESTVSWDKNAETSSRRALAQLLASHMELTSPVFEKQEESETSGDEVLPEIIIVQPPAQSE